MQIAKEEQKALIVDDERKIYSCNKGDYDVLFVEIKQNDGFDVNNFLELDESLYNKDELDPKLKEKDIYLIHYPDDESKMTNTFTTMNKVSSDKYRINNLKSINICSIGCPILNYSNFKIIGVFNSREETRLNSGNDLIVCINKFINHNNKKSEIYISFPIQITILIIMIMIIIIIIFI